MLGCCSGAAASDSVCVSVAADSSSAAAGRLPPSCPDVRRRRSPRQEGSGYSPVCAELPDRRRRQWSVREPGGCDAAQLDLGCSWLDFAFEPDSARTHRPGRWRCCVDRDGGLRRAAPLSACGTRVAAARVDHHGLTTPIALLAPNATWNALQALLSRECSRSVTSGARLRWPPHLRAIRDRTRPRSRSGARAARRPRGSRSATPGSGDL